LLVDIICVLNLVSSSDRVSRGGSSDDGRASDALGSAGSGHPVPLLQCFPHYVHGLARIVSVLTLCKGLRLIQGIISWAVINSRPDSLS
jgi:hypothetical protein